MMHGQKKHQMVIGTNFLTKIHVYTVCVSLVGRTILVRYYGTVKCRT
jgi:hypothetical protein